MDLNHILSVFIIKLQVFFKCGYELGVLQR